MGRLALADIALMADALREIATAIGCPANADPLTDLDGLVMMVQRLAQIAESRDLAAIIAEERADAVAADRMAMGAWLRNPANWGQQDIARAIEHGDHIDDDAPPLPSLRMTLLLRDELLRQVETLTAERDALRLRLECVEGEDVPILARSLALADESYLATKAALEAAGYPHVDGQPLADRVAMLAAERGRRIEPVEHAPLREIATAIGCPANVDPLADLPGLVMMVRGVVERAESRDIRLAAAEAELDKRTAPHCQHAGDPGHDIGHGVHPDRGGPSVMDAEIERLTAERDRWRGRAVMDGWLGLWVMKNGMPNDSRKPYREWMASDERARLLAHIGADVLAEVER